MRALLLWAALVAVATVAVSSCVADVMADGSRESDALHCARTLAEPTDSNIVRCFTDRGLPPPADLT